MQVIDFKGHKYPFFQAQGNAAQFAIPFAKHICQGRGFDIGCMKLEWAFPGSIPVDIEFKDPWDAYNLPEIIVDYIFSSHCLEHLPNWVDALDYWTTRIIPGGHLFLYLPHRSQLYWAPFHNRKHYHSFDGEIIKTYMENSGRYKNIFVSGVDANHSFTAFAEKK